MQFLNGVLIFIFVFLISSINLKDLSTDTNVFSFKNIFNKITVLHFLIVILSSIYLRYVFKENNILYFINFICFLGLYLCSVTDIYSKNIYDFFVILFLIPIVILNYYGMYLKISVYGILSAIFLYGSIYIISRMIYKKEVFGIGDIYVLSLVGLSTDMFTVFNIGLFAFVFAGLFCFLKFVFIFLKEIKFKVNSSHSSNFDCKSLDKAKKSFEKLKGEEIAFVPFILISYLVLIYF